MESLSSMKLYYETGEMFGHVCLQFLKINFCSKKQEEQRKYKKQCLGPVCLQLLKKKNSKFKKQIRVFR